MGSYAEETNPAYLYKTITSKPTELTVESANGIYLTLTNGQQILDATCGAAVSAIGHWNGRVKAAVMAQMDRVSYCHPGFSQNGPALELANFLVQSTGGRLSRASIFGSGLFYTTPSCL